jgi:phytoene dehydrogenase-like protein
MAGLTAACFLARAGLQVTVFEKAPVLGGRAAATRASDGFIFNRGIHALYTGGAASRTLEELGIAYGHGTPKETFVLDGRELRPFPTSPSQFLRTDLLGAGDKLALVRFFATLGRVKPHELAGTSLQEWLDLKVRRPRLHRLMVSLAYPLVYTSALNLVSAEVFVDKLQRALKHPVHYVDGGWRVLVDGLRSASERAGARVVCDAHVESVDVGNARARGVCLRDGSLVRTSAVGALPTAKGGGFAGRPDAEVPGIAGLYLAGDWVGPEGFLVDASVASARRAARLLLEDDLLARREMATGSVR